MKNPSAISMQRVGPVAALPGLVADMGGDPAEMFAGTGIDPAELRPERYIALSVFTQLLDRAALVTGRPDIALQLGMRQPPASVGPVGQLMTYAPTLGAALGDFVSFQIDNSRGAAAYLHRMGEDFGFGIGVYDPGFRTSSLAYDLAFAVGCNMIRHLTNGKVEPLEGLMIRRAPEDTAPYRQAARCPIRFDQPQCCIILPAHGMDFPLKTADPVRHAELLKQLNERLSRAPWGIAGQVRHVLRPLLLLGKDSLPEIADAMGLHLRTLERHLHQEGTSFDTLKSDVRFALARDLLSLTNLPAGEIATSLGYGSHSSFVHAFQRWAGTSPTKWRKAILSEAAS